MDADKSRTLATVGAFAASVSAVMVTILGIVFIQAETAFPFDLTGLLGKAVRLHAGWIVPVAVALAVSSLVLTKGRMRWLAGFATTVNLGLMLVFVVDAQAYATFLEVGLALLFAAAALWIGAVAVALSRGKRGLGTASWIALGLAWFAVPAAIIGWSRVFPA